MSAEARAAFLRVQQALEELGPEATQWKEVYDPSSGASYYFHRSTRATTWSAPAVGYISLQVQKLREDAVAALARAGLSVEQVQADVQHDEAAEQTQEQTQPTLSVQVEHVESAPVSSLPVQHPGALQVSGGDSSLLAPDSSSPAHRLTVDLMHEDASDAPKPRVERESDWQECYDFKTKSVYYWNRKTNVTTWEKPAVLLGRPSPEPDAGADDAEPESVSQPQPSQDSPELDPYERHEMLRQTSLMRNESRESVMVAYDNVHTAEVARPLQANLSSPTIVAGGPTSRKVPDMKLGNDEVSEEDEGDNGGEGEADPNSDVSDAESTVSTHTATSTSSAGVTSACRLPNEGMARAPELLRHPTPMKTNPDVAEARAPSTEELFDFTAPIKRGNAQISRSREKRMKQTRQVFFSTKKTAEEQLRFSTSKQSKPLLLVNRKKKDTTQRTSKYIQAYMGDRKSVKSEKDLLLRLLAIELEHETNASDTDPSYIGDEMLLQVCRQTRQNPRWESEARGWQLLHLFLCCFPPNLRTVFRFIDLYCQACIVGTLTTMSMRNSEKVARMADRCRLALHASYTVGRRVLAPTLWEIKRLLAFEDLSVPVYMMDGSYLTVVIDSFTRGDGLNSAMVAKAGIKFEFPFAIYRDSPSAISRGMLGGSDRVVDVLAEWESLGVAKESQLLFRAKLMLPPRFPDVLGDAEALRLMYYQAARDFVSGRTPFDDATSAMLAALSMQASFGRYVRTHHTQHWMWEHLGDFYPRVGELTVQLKEDAVASVLNTYKTLGNLSEEEARLAFLREASQNELFGVAMFGVEQRQIQGVAQQVVLGVTSEAVLLLDMDTRAVVKRWELSSDVVTWGVGPDRFVLVVGSVVQQKKLVFKTNAGAHIKHLIHNYVKHMMAHSEAARVSATNLPSSPTSTSKSSKSKKGKKKSKKSKKEKRKSVMSPQLMRMAARQG